MSSRVQQLFSLNLPLASFIECQFHFKWKLAEMRIIILSSLPHPWFVNLHRTLLWLLLLWGKKPKLFNLLWNETFCAFAGCTQEELVSLSNKSSFVWFSLIHFLRRRKALAQVGWEAEEFLLGYLKFPLFLPKVWNIKLISWSRRVMGLGCAKLPKIWWSHVFSVDFAAGPTLSRMGSKTQSNPKVSMWSWMWGFKLNPGKLERRESGGVEAEEPLCRHPPCSRCCSWRISSPLCGHVHGWEKGPHGEKTLERNQSHFPESFGVLGIWKKKK